MARPELSVTVNNYCLEERVYLGEGLPFVMQGLKYVVPPMSYAKPAAFSFRELVVNFDNSKWPVVVTSRQRNDQSRFQI